MKRSKLKRIVLAAALAGTMAASDPTFTFAQSAPDLMETLSTQVLAANYAAGRATIAELQALGIGAISIGSDTITLDDLLVMIDAVEQGQLNRVQLATYLDAIAKNAAQAVYLPENSGTDRRRAAISSAESNAASAHPGDAACWRGVNCLERGEGRAIALHGRGIVRRADVIGGLMEAEAA